MANLAEMYKEQLIYLEDIKVGDFIDVRETTFTIKKRDIIPGPYKVVEIIDHRPPYKPLCETCSTDRICIYTTGRYIDGGNTSACCDRELYDTQGRKYQSKKG
jgi:hypothetical protein